MRIIVDGMGGDNAPKAIVEGVVLAAQQLSGEYEICLVGREEPLKKELKKYEYDPQQITITNADEIISMDDAPVRAVRTKKKSSLVTGIEMVKSGEGDVFISAGNSGALMAGGLFTLGRIHGIDRPAIASVYPVLGGEPQLMVDAGANSECKPGNLLEFAMMGSIYAEKVWGRSEPEIGLVNLGVEENKGSTLTKAAYELLSRSGLNFTGNVEARELPDGACDVIVCDGFTGNVILKLTEGFAMHIWNLLKEKLTETPKSKLGAMLLKSQLKDLKSEFDYSEYGGAPILGVRGAIIKMHGSSNANAVKNTVIKSIPYVEHDVVSKIQNQVVELEEIVNSEQEE